MANFVLVHGSGQNRDSWSRVAEHLEKRGHTATAPDLLGRPPDWGLGDYASEIAAAIGTPESIVVAHSFSGVFLPLVPRIRDCALLVFVAAVIPEPGKSVRQQFDEDPTMFSPDWIAAGSRWFDDSRKESLAREFVLHDCDDETLDWALPTVDYLDTRALVTEPCPLDAWPDIRGASVVASADRTLSPDWIRGMTRRMLNDGAIEVDAGHAPQVSQAAEVARILDILARLALR